MAGHETGILNSEQCPQFFKLYMPAHCSTLLRIPSAFLKYFGDFIPFRFTLITSENSWVVDMNKIDDDIYFKTGWEKFVKDNSLEFGDFLIFYYNGGSNFYVSISGKNNCLKETKIANNMIETQPPVPPPIQETEKDETGKLNQVSNTRNQIEDSKFSFETTIQPSYMRNKYMVFRDGVKEFRSMAKIQHLGRTWSVKVVDGGDRVRLTNGWNLFAMENCLGLGDVCCFKVIDVTPEFYLLDVSFSREI
ncbi:hypothetical protein L1887_36354 [Cichorium endivia]|nr:hypothetical protein L1887_36354 [Cichorium endivia]